MRRQTPRDKAKMLKNQQCSGFWTGFLDFSTSFFSIFSIYFIPSLSDFVDTFSAWPISIGQFPSFV
jgi:hypothetical protein